MEIEQLNNLGFDDLEFIHKGYLAQLAIGSAPIPEDEDRLTNILRHNPMLIRLQIQHQDRSTSIITPELTLQSLMKIVIVETSGQLESFSISYARLVLTMIRGVSQYMTLKFDRLEDLTSDDLNFIQLGPYDQLRIENTQEVEERLIGLLRQSSVLGPTVQDLVDLATADAPTNLESFSVGCQRLILTAVYSQGRIQDMTMTIGELQNLDSNDLTFIHRGHLTQLIIEAAPIPEDEDRLVDIFRHNSMLTRLQVGQGRSASVTPPELPLQRLVKTATSNTSSQLQSLSVDYGRFALTMTTPDGQAQEMVLRFNRLDDLTSGDLKFIQQGPYGQLRIETTWEEDKESLIDILRQSPAIEYIQIKGGGEQSHIIISTIGWPLENLVSLATLKANSEIECSFLVGCQRFTLTAGYSQGIIQDMTMEVGQLESLDSNDLAFIHQGHLTQLVIDSVPLSKDEDRLAGIFRHNSTLTRLQVRHGRSASVTTPELPLQNLVKIATSDTLCRLQPLSVDYGRFTLTVPTLDDQTQEMIMRFNRLDDLTSGDLKFIQQGPYGQLRIETTWEEDKESLIDILRQSPAIGYIQTKVYGRRPIVISVCGTKIEDLIHQAARTISTRLRASDTLESFSVGCKRLSLKGLMESHIAGMIGTTDMMDLIEKSMYIMDMTIGDLQNLDSNDITFIHRNRKHISQLVIEAAPMLMDEDRLKYILCHHWKLSRLQIQHQGRDEVPADLELPLQTLVKLALRNTSSFSVCYRRLNLIGGLPPGCTKDRTKTMAMTVDQLEDLTSDDMTFIQQGSLTHFTLRFPPLKMDTDRLSGILRHSLELSQFHIILEEETILLDATQPIMNLQDVLGIVDSATLTKLESSTIDYGYGPITANVSQGRIQEVAMDIERLGDLSSGYIKFIQGNRLTKLYIKHTPQAADQNLLTEILSQCPFLGYLQVGCRWDRSLAIVNLMVSVREMILEREGSSSLRIFELMDEGLIPFDELGSRDDNTHIQSHLSFSGDSNSFEMRTWIRLGDWMFEKDVGPVRSFVRRYGWSVVRFDGSIINGNAFTSILNHMPDTRTFQLEHLMIHSSDFSEDGVNHLDNMIIQSPDFKGLGLYVGNWHLERAPLLHPTLSRLQLFGGNSEVFSRIALSFPTRRSFPALESFELRPDSDCQLPLNFFSWIMAMVSATSQGLSSSSSSHFRQDTVAEQSAHCELDPERSWTPLRKVMLRQVRLQYEEWRSVIEAMDTSALEHLDLKDANIYPWQFQRVKNGHSAGIRGSLAMLRAQIALQRLEELQYVLISFEYHPWAAFMIRLQIASTIVVGA
ncbi:MAG: hypothetical protein J3Q66DRAFT_426107 [Benniella sp.]|nr:MAG: hypothetical protein J3Q66DRAFT_426107 [Benniella sp.]